MQRSQVLRGFLLWPLAIVLLSGCVVLTRSWVNMVAHDHVAVTARGEHPVLTLRNDGPQDVRLEIDRGSDTEERALPKGQTTRIEGDGPVRVHLFTGPGMGADVWVKADRSRALQVDQTVAHR